MDDALTTFPPTQLEARARLAEFVPQAGSAYAMRRNFDYGAGRHGSVSTLSPYVRLRMLDEVEITRAVVAQHTEQQAEKFLAEVFWRTYWKGWMELRPGVWDIYTYDLKRLCDEIQTQSGLRSRWEEACLGQTGIAPFDAWAQELVQTGYLHNHARMWFASIWIFTLELPWQLGADFFLRHLLDGDAAVNTLSWRWVAGIQTRGKTYLASQENIAKFTNGRFSAVPGLAPTAIAQDAEEKPPPRMLPHLTDQTLSGKYGILLHDEDIAAAPLLEKGSNPAAWAYLNPTALNTPWQMAPHVTTFRKAAAQDQLQQGDVFRDLTTANALRDWAVDADLDYIITPYAPVGPTQSMLNEYMSLPDAVPLTVLRRPLDSEAWPLATKGFFPFRKNIPRLIKTFATG
jgi:deoxyribodipyrimidine photo-lyase